MKILIQATRAAIVYFALVFGAGFALGLVQVLFLEPRLGDGAAELAEMPLMFVVIVLSARFVVRRCSLPPSLKVRCATGLLALLLLLCVEVFVAVALRGLSPEDYVAGRDPAAGVAYLAMLLVFGFMPAVLCYKR